jgi:hypothetical protein
MGFVYTLAAGKGLLVLEAGGIAPRQPDQNAGIKSSYQQGRLIKMT